MNIIPVKFSAITWLSILLLLAFSLRSMALATAETVLVPARQTFSRNIDLNPEDEVSGRITVVGSDESHDINFTVVGPSNQIVLPTQSITVTNFKFSASNKGTYSLIFDNSLSSIEKSVSFNYDVKHYWFGMPQEFVLMLIVVFVGVLALVAYAMASKR